MFPCAGIDRRSPPNSKRAEKAARSIRPGLTISTPCPARLASMPLCCLLTMALVMVKTTAWRIGDQRFFLLLNERQGSDAYRGVQCGGPHWDQHQVSLRYGPAHQPRCHALQVNDHDPAVRVLRLDGTDDLRSPTSDWIAIRGGKGPLLAQIVAERLGHNLGGRSRHQRARARWPTERMRWTSLPRLSAMPQSLRA